MTIKSLERPLIEAAQNLALTKATLVDNQYMLNIAELEAADKLELLSQFMKITVNLDTYLQEFLNDACMDRMYAESQPFGAWDE